MDRSEARDHVQREDFQKRQLSLGTRRPWPMSCFSPARCPQLVLVHRSATATRTQTNQRRLIREQRKCCHKASLAIARGCLLMREVVDLTWEGGTNSLG